MNLNMLRKYSRHILRPTWSQILISVVILGCCKLTVVILLRLGIRTRCNVFCRISSTHFIEILKRWHIDSKLLKLQTIPLQRIHRIILKLLLHWNNSQTLVRWIPLVRRRNWVNVHLYFWCFGLNMYWKLDQSIGTAAILELVLESEDIYNGTVITNGWWMLQVVWNFVGKTEILYIAFFYTESLHWMQHSPLLFFVILFLLFCNYVPFNQLTIQLN